MPRGSIHVRKLKGGGQSYQVQFMKGRKPVAKTFRNLFDAQTFCASVRGESEPKEDTVPKRNSRRGPFGGKPDLDAMIREVVAAAQLARLYDEIQEIESALYKKKRKPNGAVAASSTEREVPLAGPVARRMVGRWKEERLKNGKAEKRKKPHWTQTPRGRKILAGHARERFHGKKAKSKKVHWTQTPEGKAKMSATMKAKYASGWRTRK